MATYTFKRITLLIAQFSWLKVLQNQFRDFLLYSLFFLMKNIFGKSPMAEASNIMMPDDLFKLVAEPSKECRSRDATKN